MSRTRGMHRCGTCRRWLRPGPTPSLKTRVASCADPQLMCNSPRLQHTANGGWASALKGSRELTKMCKWQVPKLTKTARCIFPPTLRRHRRIRTSPEANASFICGPTCSDSDASGASCARLAFRRTEPHSKELRSQGSGPISTASFP